MKRIDIIGPNGNDGDHYKEEYIVIKRADLNKWASYFQKSELSMEY